MANDADQNWILFRDARALANWLAAASVVDPKALSRGWTVLELEAGPKGPALALAPSDGRGVKVSERIAPRVVKADAKYEPSHSILNVFAPESMTATYKVTAPRTYPNAIQAVPLVSWEHEPAADAEILFWLPTRDDLVRLVRRHLAIDNHHVQVAAARTGSGEEAWLLKATKPNWYLVLHEARRSGTRTFWRLPNKRVYVRWGWMHPLADHVKDPGEGKVLMADVAGWRSFRGGAWRDVGEVVSFEVGDRRLAASPEPLELKIRLALEGRPEPRETELWILPWSQAHRLESIMSRLSPAEARRIQFADIVLEGSGDRFLLVREAVAGTGLDERAKRLLSSPPAMSYGMVKGLQGLALPVSKSLVPPLKPERISALLALGASADGRQSLTIVDDPGTDDGSLMVTKVPEAAFRPLDRFVDVLGGEDAERIRSTITAAAFDLSGLFDVDSPPRKKNPGAFVEDVP